MMKSRAVTSVLTGCDKARLGQRCGSCCWAAYRNPGQQFRAGFSGNNYVVYHSLIELSIFSITIAFIFGVINSYRVLSILTTYFIGSQKPCRKSLGPDWLLPGLMALGIS